MDKKTVKEILSHLKKRFQIKKCIFVGDRGLISTENLQAIEDEKFDSILAIKKRRHRQVRSLLLGAGPLIYCIESEELWWPEVKGDDELGYLVCYNRPVGAEQKQRPMQPLGERKNELEERKQTIAQSKKRLTAKTLVRRMEGIRRRNHGKPMIDYRIQAAQHSFIGKKQRRSSWKKRSMASIVCAPKIRG